MAASRVWSVFRPNLFTNRSAIITGGGTGIGQAIAQELLHLGCNVMVASRKVERLAVAVEKMRSGLPEDAPSIEYMQCNIRKEEEVKTLVSETIAKFGGLDFVINNGGGQFVSPAADIRAKGWHAVLETNLTGTFYMCQQAYHQWMKDHGGAIVNIIADMWKGMPGMCHSGAARAGVDNITKTLALEWAPAGIRINSVSPGSSIWSQTAQDNYGDHNPFEQQVPRIPASRLGKPEEISGMVCFLLSPAAAFITGESVKIDGGQHVYSTTLPWPIPEHKNMPAFDWENPPKSKL